MKENVTQQDANLTVDTVEPVAENSAPESVDKKRKIKFFTAGNMAVMAILTARVAFVPQIQKPQKRRLGIGCRLRQCDCIFDSR